MSMLHKRSILAVASLFAIGAAGAQAPAQSGGTQSTPPAQTQKGFTGEHRSGVWSGETFSRLDVNRDGMISRDEAQADPAIRDAWSRLDAKNAGRVSRADFDAYGATAQSPSNQFNSGGPAPTTAPKK